MDRVYGQAAYDLAYNLQTEGVGISVLNPPSGVAAAKGDGITNDTAAIVAAIAYVSAAGGGIVYFPKGTYLITPGITIPSNVWLQGDSTATIKTASATRYRIMIATESTATNVRIRGLIFNQMSDSHGVVPTNVGDVGCHMLHLPDNNNIEVSDCKFYGYGITLLLEQPQTYSEGNNIKIENNYFEWQRQYETTVYDVSIMNVGSIDAAILYNTAVATRKAGIRYWQPETAYELHIPRGLVIGNTAKNVKNAILHMGVPSLYTSYDTTVVGGCIVAHNTGTNLLTGFVAWGGQFVSGAITRNLMVHDNYFNCHLGGFGGLKPSQAIAFIDGGIDASYFRNCSIIDNHIKFTWTRYVSGESKITFGTNTITTTGDDFKDYGPGDYVAISGCTVNTGNNKSAFITSVTDKVLTFAAGTFTAGAETAAITVQIHVIDFMSSALSSLYTGAIMGVTNNSIQDLDITGNIVESWPYSGVALRALQTRGTNLHRRIKIYDNKFLDCAFIPPVDSVWQGVFALEECLDVDIRFNKIVKGGVANVTCLKLLSFGDSNVTNIRFTDNDCSTLTAREAEYESLSVLQANLTTDLYEFIALGCLPSNTQPQVLTAAANVFTINMANSMLRNARATIADNTAKTISVTNPQVGCEIYLELVHTDGNGITYTMNSGSSIVWLDGAAPTLADGKTYRFSFVYAATNVWHGHCVGGW